MLWCKMWCKFGFPFSHYLCDLWDWRYQNTQRTDHRQREFQFSYDSVCLQNWNGCKNFDLKEQRFKQRQIFLFYIRKQPTRSVLKKRCSENKQQIYRRTPMPKCEFNKVAKQLYWNRTSAWVFSCKFAAYFQNTFS